MIEISNMFKSRGRPTLDLNILKISKRKMLCAKFGCNWPHGSGEEVQNFIKPPTPPSASVRLIRIIKALLTLKILHFLFYFNLSIAMVFTRKFYKSLFTYHIVNTRVIV